MSDVNKVVIAGWHHDSNRGDTGILMGMIEAIRRVNPNAQVSVMLYIHHESILFESALQYVGSVVEVEPLTSFLRLGRPSSSERSSKWVRIRTVLRSLILLVAPSIGERFLDENEAKCLRRLRSADILLAKGGQYIYTGQESSEVFRLYKTLYPFLLRARFGRNYAFLGQSFGGFSDVFTRVAGCWMLRRAGHISVRERQSWEYLRHFCGCSASKSGDYAFMINGGDLEEAHRKDSGFSIALVPRFSLNREYSQGLRNRQNELLLRLGSKVDELLDASVTLRVATTTWAGSSGRGESDETGARWLCSQLQIEKSIVHPRNPEIFIQKLASFDLVLSTRLHGALFALRAGVPSIHLAYVMPKAYAVSEFMGKDFVVNLGESEAWRKLCHAVERVGREGPQLRVMIDRRTSRLETCLEDDMRMALEENTATVNWYNQNER